MEGHKKEYLDHFYPDWGPDDYIPCERCGKASVDIHHLDPKRMGGTKRKYTYKDLAALCRKCHNYAHKSKETLEEVKKYHSIFIKWKQIG